MVYIHVFPVRTSSRYNTFSVPSPDHGPSAYTLVPSAADHGPPASFLSLICVHPQFLNCRPRPPCIHPQLLPFGPRSPCIRYMLSCYILTHLEFLHDITIATHGGEWLEAYIDFKLHLSKSRTSLEAYFNFKFNFSKSRTSFCKPRGICFSQPANRNMYYIVEIISYQASKQVASSGGQQASKQKPPCLLVSKSAEQVSGFLYGVAAGFPTSQAPTF